MMSNKRSYFQSSRRASVKSRFYDYGANPSSVYSAINESEVNNVDIDHIVDEPKKILIIRKEEELHIGKKLLSSILSDEYEAYTIGDSNYDDNVVIQSSLMEVKKTAIVVESLHVNKEPIRAYIHEWKKRRKEERDNHIIIVTALPEYIQSLFRLYEYSVIIAPDGMVNDEFVLPTTGTLRNIPITNLVLGDSHQEFISINDNGDLVVMNSENNGTATILTEKPLEKRGLKNVIKMNSRKAWLKLANFLSLGYEFETNEENVVFNPARKKKLR